MAHKTFHREYVSDIVTVYGDQPTDAPTLRVRETNGRNDDINGGFAGRYVWFIPSYTNATSKGITNFDIDIQATRDPAKTDFAKGDGGKCRYLVSAQEPKRIFDVGLLRSRESVREVPQGYDGKTKDLNMGRGGDYLYLVWKSAQTSPGDYMPRVGVDMVRMVSIE